MEKLLEMAMDAADQAEVFFRAQNITRLTMRNGSVTETSTSMTSGYSLRIIRDGILGSACTRNLADRRDLVSNAVVSLEGGVEAGYRLPGPHDPASLDTFHPSIDGLGYTDLAEVCRSVLDSLKGRVAGQVDCSGGFEKKTTRVVNSNSLDVSSTAGGFYVGAQVLFPATETSIGQVRYSLDKCGLPSERLDEIVELYSRGLEEVEAPTGRMKVLFHPHAMNTLTWRLRSALSARSVYFGTSPLIGRKGERVLSDRITFVEDPHAAGAIGTTPFDDEGVPTRKLPLIRDGVFESLYTNLDYAARLGIEPTGSGFRGEDAIEGLPAAGLAQEGFEPGDMTFDEMVSSMDEGVILMGALGAHSGNIINGDFSVGMNPGLLVRNGRIVGRVRDGMVAGNVWDVMQRVIGVEDRIHDPSSWARYPCVLLDGVNVSGTKA